MSDLVQAAGEGIDEAIRRSTVGIVTGSGTQKWTGIGTGTLIRWQGQTAILTAAHVLNATAPADLRFFFPEDATPKKVDRESLRALTGAMPSQLSRAADVAVHGIVTDAALDLAAILVDGTLDEQYPFHYFELSQGGASPAADTTIMCFGFPRDTSRLTLKNERVVFSYSEWSKVAPTPVAPWSELDASKHFVAPYGTLANHPDANPLGLSGSGAWFRKGPTPTVWHPNLDLGGVTLAFHKPSGLLKMARREVVEEFLTRL